MIVRLFFVISFLFVFVRLSADESSWDDTVSRADFASPWIFARPLERCLRIGLIAPASAQQEAQQLKQRFDCEIIPLSLGTETSASLSKVKRQTLAEKIRNGKFDVLVLARIEWDVLGAELSAQIVEAAQRDGLGIVFLCSPKPPTKAGDPLMPVLLPENEFIGLGLAKLPGFGFARDDASFFSDYLKGFSIGKGRLLVVYYGLKESSKHHCLVPDASRWKKGFNHYDLQLAFVGKAIRWAARMTPTTILEKVDCTSIVKSGENPKLTCTVRGGFGQQLQFEIRVRRFTPSTYDPEPIFVEKTLASQQIAFKLPAAIPAGDYAAMIRLTSKGQTLDWACARFSVESPSKIKKMEIHRLALPENSSIVPINVMLENAPQEGTRLRAESRDAYNRLLGSIEIPCKKKTSFLKAPCARSKSSHNRAIITLLNAAGQALDQQTIIFRIHQQHSRQELSFFSQNPEDADFAAQLFCQKMASWNVDALSVDFPDRALDLPAEERLSISRKLDQLGMLNLSSLPRIHPLFSDGGKSQNPAEIFPSEKQIQRCQEKIEVVRRHSPIAVSLGSLPPANTDDSADAKNAEAYKKIISSLSPKLPCVPIGIENFQANSASSGLFDLPLLQLQFSAPLQLELVRSFSHGKDNLRVCCFATDHHHPALPVYQRWFPWTALFHGMNAVCFDPDSIGGIEMVEPAHLWKATATAVANAKAGVDLLLLSAEADDHGIAILHSPRSATIGRRIFQYGDSRRATFAMTRLLEDSGFQYRLLDESSIVGKMNLRKQCAVLILPTSLCISDAAVEKIKGFVRNGGALIADWGAGLYDEHGEKRPSPPFQEMFGIRLRGTQHTIAKIESNLPDFFFTAVFEKGNKLKEGMAKCFINGFPLFITHSLVNSNLKGKGKTAFFNFGIEGYLQARGARGENLRQWLQDFIATSKAHPPVRLQGQWNKHPEQVEAFRWKRGDETYIAVLKEPETTAAGEDITLRLDAHMHVYDTFNGKYRGKVNEIKFHLAPGEARLFAILPYHVTSLNATRLSGEKYPNPAFHLNAPGHDGGRKSTRVYRIEVFDPDGKPYQAAIGDHLAAKGTLDFDIPLDLDPQPGRWHFKATDAATGFSVEKEFIVKNGKM